MSLMEKGEETGDLPFDPAAECKMRDSDEICLEWEGEGIIGIGFVYLGGDFAAWTSDAEVENSLNGFIR